MAGVATRARYTRSSFFLAVFLATSAAVTEPAATERQSRPMVPSAVSQWCQRLVEFHEKDSSCHDSATTSVTYGSSAGGVCRCSVPRASTGSDIAGMGLGEQQPTFLSRSGVDWWLWTNHARFLRTPGAIIDLTVPQENYTLPEGSASYFLEHCMRWTGVCSPTTKGFRTCSPKSSVSPTSVNLERKYTTHAYL